MKIIQLVVLMCLTLICIKSAQAQNIRHITSNDSRSFLGWNEVEGTINSDMNGVSSRLFSLNTRYQEGDVSLSFFSGDPNNTWSLRHTFSSPNNGAFTISHSQSVNAPFVFRENGNLEIPGNLIVNGDLTSTNGTLNLEAPTADSYALVTNGAIHIGPHPDHFSYDGGPSLAHENALDDVFLFVEQGIATEDMTYIFSEDWDSWPDYVFADDYALNSLEYVEEYIKEHQHLPDVISQQEVKEIGVSDKQMNITLLKKIEELTLYTIELNKQMQQMQRRLEGLEGNKEH